MIPIATRKRIKDLIEAGTSMALTADLLGVSLRSAKRIAKEHDFANDDASERRRRRIGRPSVTRKYGWLVRDCLTVDPTIKVKTIIQLTRKKGYRGGDSAMYRLVRGLRVETDHLLRAETPPSRSETSPHGFGDRATR